MIRGIEVLNTEQKDYSQFDKWEVYLCSVGSREEYKQILEKTNDYHKTFIDKNNT